MVSIKKFRELEKAIKGLMENQTGCLTCGIRGDILQKLQATFTRLGIDSIFAIVALAHVGVITSHEDPFGTDIKAVVGQDCIKLEDYLDKLQEVLGS